MVFIQNFSIKKIGKRLIKKLIENTFQSMALAFTTFTVYTLNSVQQISRTLFTLNEWFLTMRPIGLALLAAFWAAWYSKREIKFWHPHFFAAIVIWTDLNAFGKRMLLCGLDVSSRNFRSVWSVSRVSEKMGLNIFGNAWNFLSVRKKRQTQ